MAQDPSHPNKHKDSTQQSEQQPQAPHDEASTSSSDSDSAAWLQLALGPSSPHRKRRRTDEGPSTPVPPPAPPPPSLPPQHLSLLPGPSSTSVVAAAPPPPAHEAGMWFMLRAAQNQRPGEPPLPQIPRSFLRVRDGRMTVRVVMRYLANKLGLQDESQVEITCRGQRLIPATTLQHVRDTIWRPPPQQAAATAAAVLPVPGAPSTNHIMTLHYSRS